jgi:hypothetical protein
MAKFKYVVFTEAVPGREEAFNDWYTNVHVPDLLALDGFMAAQRFKLVALDSNSQPASKYMAIYDLEGDDPKAILGQLANPALIKGMVMTDAIDLSSAKTILYQPVTEIMRKP